MTEQTPLKRCTKCGQEKPATLEYFHQHNQMKDGLRPSCKLCIRKTPLPLPVSPGMKRCSKCVEEKPATLEYFPARAQGQNGLEAQCRPCCHTRARNKYLQNRDAISAREHSRYLQNRDAILEAGRAKYAANRDKEIARQRKAYQEKKDQFLARQRRHYEANKERKAQSSQRWRAANPVKCSIYTVRYNARKRSLPDTLTAQDWQRALDYFGGCCAVCGRAPSTDWTLAADHWIALTDPRPDNPGTVPWNIVPLCHGRGGCNNRKQNFKAIDWLTRQYPEAEATAILTRILNYFEQVKS